MTSIINQEYIKNYLIDNKIIFPTNLHDNVLNGFQNYGPIGLKIKSNILNEWRKIFIQDDNIFEKLHGMVDHYFLRILFRFLRDLKVNLIFQQKVLSLYQSLLW